MAWVCLDYIQSDLYFCVNAEHASALYCYYYLTIMIYLILIVQLHFGLLLSSNCLA